MEYEGQTCTLAELWDGYVTLRYLTLASPSLVF